MEKLLSPQKPWEPDPRNEPQVQAYNCEADELLYGGKAGGGKSDLLLGLARCEHRRSVLFRRTYDRLEDSIIPRSVEFYGDRKFYNGSKYFWWFPEENRRVRFAHLEREETKFKYKSAQFDFMGFDELSEFTEGQYVYLRSRLRTVTKGQRCRTVGCTNPGDEGEEWIIRRWAPWLDDKCINPAEPGELRYYKRNEAGEEIETTADDPNGISRTFIPASLEDNPYLGEEYRIGLESLPEPYRSQLARGVWGVNEEDDRWQVIPTAWVRAAQDRWEPRDIVSAYDTIGVDVAYGGKDKTVFSGRVGNWFAELKKYDGRQTPDGQTAAGFLFEFTKGDPDILIDATGYGASCYDFSKEHFKARSFIAARKSEAKDKTRKLGFTNKRAESWWKFREALDPNSGEEIALPPDRELLGDLTKPRWKLMSNGIQIESKDQLIKRLGRSPDCGDAVILAYHALGEQAIDFAVDSGDESFKSRIGVFR